MGFINVSALKENFLKKQKIFIIFICQINL